MRHGRFITFSLKMLGICRTSSASWPTSRSCNITSFRMARIPGASSVTFSNETVPLRQKNLDTLSVTHAEDSEHVDTVSAWHEPMRPCSYVV